MKSRIVTALALGSGLLAAVVMADQGMLKNGSMENGPGPNGPDPRIPAGWTLFGENSERSPTVNLTPAGLGYALKAFGDSTNTTAGALQIINGVAPGQSVSCSVSCYSPSFDKLGGSANAGIVLEFLNSFNGVIGGFTQSVFPFNSASPADTWVPASIGPATAPSGTAKVRITCRLNFTIGEINGAVYWDGAVCTVNGGPNIVVNGNFETEGNSPGQSVAGIDDWSGFEDQEKSTLFARNGSASLQIGMHKPYSGLYQFMDTVSAGDHIYLLGYAYHPSTDPMVSDAKAGIKLEFNSSSQVPPPEENLPFTQAAAEDTWTPVSLSTTVPPGMTIARVVMIYVGDSVSTGELYVDSASAIRGSIPAVNQLVNPSFEFGPSPDVDNWTRFEAPPNSESTKSCFTYSLNGICSLKLSGTTVAGAYQEIAVTPGESLNIQAQLFSPSGNPMTGGAKAGVKIEWAAGGVPGDVDLGVACSSSNTMGACSPTNTWIPLFLDYTMPANSSAVAQYTLLVVKGNALTGHVYFDACEAIVINRFNWVDQDGDDDSDMADFAALQRSYAGSGVPPTGTPWKVYDIDLDNDVDFADATYFWSNMIGPN